MQVHWRAGDRAAALQVYQSCQKTLRRDLDTEPSQDLVALADQIRAQTRPLMQSAHKTEAQRGRAAVVCFGFSGQFAGQPAGQFAGQFAGQPAGLFAEPKDAGFSPQDHLKAQVRLRNRVLTVVSAAGGHVVEGATDRVVAVLCSGAYEHDCRAAIEVALSVIATPVVVGDHLALRPSAGIAGGDVLLPLVPARGALSDEVRFLAGAPLHRATLRVGLAEAGTLVAGLEVPEVQSDRYDVTQLPSDGPTDPNARRVRAWRV
jgi:hypothetical protein